MKAGWGDIATSKVGGDLIEDLARVVASEF
jgi:hypothetical protein